MTSRPLPTPTALTEGFWAAAREHRLVAQRCDDCGRLRHHPQERCPECTSAAWRWSPVSGRGVVYTFTRSHKPTGSRSAAASRSFRRPARHRRHAPPLPPDLSPTELAFVRRGTARG